MQKTNELQSWRFVKHSCVIFFDYTFLFQDPNWWAFSFTDISRRYGCLLNPLYISATKGTRNSTLQSSTALWQRKQRAEWNRQWARKPKVFPFGFWGAIKRGGGEREMWTWKPTPTAVKGAKRQVRGRQESPEMGVCCLSNRLGICLIARSKALLA